MNHSRVVNHPEKEIGGAVNQRVEERAADEMSCVRA